MKLSLQLPLFMVYLSYNKIARFVIDEVESYYIDNLLESCVIQN